MFDVFTEEIEALIKEGIANLYWFKADLKRVWLRAGISEKLTGQLFSAPSPDGSKRTKRELMEDVYLKIRHWPRNRRLEVSRNFVRTLVEHQNFSPQDHRHRVERAEHAALRLKEIIREQTKANETRDRKRRQTEASRKRTQENEIPAIYQSFLQAMTLDPQKRGYELEKVFTRLAKESGIEVHEPFKIVGEQIDGAIKFEGHHYLIELRWREEKANQQAIAGLYLKVEGKLEARGIFISMNGFSSELIQSLPKGKELKVLLLDGCHITNVLSELYTFQKLLNYAIAEASLKGNIYCSTDLGRDA